MTNVRGLLLAVIGVLSGAWLSLDFLKREKKPTPPRPEPPSAKVSTPSAPPKKRAEPVPDKSADTPKKPESAPEAQTGHSDVRKIYGPVGYLMELFKRFGADQCPAWAGALSFFSILSIPFVLLCGLALLGYIIEPSKATAQIQHLLASVLPGGGKAAEQQAAQIIGQLNVEKSIHTLHQQRGVAGIIGVLSLVWSSLQIFLNAMSPVNAAFRAKETRGAIQLRLYAAGLLLGTGVLFLISLLPASGVQVINSLHLPFIGSLPVPSPPLISVILLLVGVAINSVMFTIIYRFLPSPSAGVDWKEARFAGIIVAILWEAAKQGFAFYLNRMGSAGYNKVYGSLGGAVALVFWIYYTSMILLLGAEIAKLYSDAREAKPWRHKA